jgi:exodeoxyribonuclease V alpha subunit
VRRRLGAPQPKATPYPEWLVDAVGDGEGSGEPVYLAWEIARTATDATPAEREALIAVATLAMRVLSEGSTYLDVSELSDRLAALGASADVVDTAARVVGDESEVLGRPGDYKPLIMDETRLYLQRVHRQESELARRLKDRLDRKADRGDYMKILDALDRVLAHRAVVNGRVVQLSAAQQHAVRTALTRAFTVISGGPGTGKTSILVSILRVLARLDFAIENVVLAAPTGRAARRMGESIELGFAAVPEPKIIDASVAGSLPSPRTLHRLLGYSPARHRFRHDATHPLPYELVIVDEASMIDLEMMHRLVSAVRPDAKLVLLGDADQLPSVHPGAVFADVVAAGRGRASVELSGNYRVDRKDAAGRALAAAFAAVRGGEPEAVWKSVTSRAAASEVELHGVEILEADRESFFDRWFTERVMTPGYRELVEAETFDGDAVFALLRRHGVLTATSSDARRVNRAFAARNPSRVGEPVVVRRNDYERGLFNGELGVVTRSGVHFESGLVETRALAGELETAYAITVHQSQGAECDHVVLVLPAADHPLLTRELLYTAMTRARKSVTLLGSKEALIAGAGRALERRTGILSRMA